MTEFKVLLTFVKDIIYLIRIHRGLWKKVGLPLELWRGRNGCPSPGVRKSPGKMAAITLNHRCALFVHLAVHFGLVFCWLSTQPKPRTISYRRMEVFSTLAEPSPIEQVTGLNNTKIIHYNTTACTVHTAVCYFWLKCKWSIAKKNIYGAILTDLSKAFDCLPHRLILVNWMPTGYTSGRACSLQITSWTGDS